MKRKIKHTYEYRLSCVQAVLNKHQSARSVARQFGCDESCIRGWIRFYSKYGPAGIVPVSSRTYDLNFKLKVLDTIKKKSLTLKEAGLMYAIPSDSVIRTWQRNFAKDGIAGLN